MQSHPIPAPAQEPSSEAPKAARQSTNNDANLLVHSLKRMSLATHTATETSRPQSPGFSVPRRRPSELQRVSSSPGLPPLSPNSPRRSPSVASLNRASSPALGRRTSTASLRRDMSPTPPTPRGAASRRSSLNPHMASPNMPKSPLAPQAEQKPPMRACDVAEEYFKKELALHEGIAGAATAGTLVLIHDQCYGHRFSRPKTSKAALSTIVERPERILATVLGISTAYVRLGDRHCDGDNPPHPHHNPPTRIPFKIRKTSRAVQITSPVVTNVHGTKWMQELHELATDAPRKLAATGKELAREPSAPGQSPKQQFHETDLYLCSESLNAFQGALGGVLDAVDAVFQGTSLGTGPSRAFVCIRPPGHHCSADYPSGFCWINNVHVGIEHAIQQHGLTHAAIIDFDLHHGDGSQAITWERNKKVQAMHKNTPSWKKTSIGYFSLHDINSFPCEYGDDDKVQAASLCIDNAHGQSIWNIHLQPWKTVDEFWKLYEDKYLVLLDKTRQYLKHHTERLRKASSGPAAKSAIFISAGFDASEWETQGMQRHGANVPTEFYDRFTRDIVRLSEEDGTGVDGRVISVLEGGYSNRALTSGVLSHISGLTDGQVWSDGHHKRGIARDFRSRLNGLSLHDGDDSDPMMQDELTPVSGNPAWWHQNRLTELENLVDPPPIVIPKKVRSGPPAHFSSPTQSFTAKVVDPSKLQHSVSGRFSASPSRAPTPPPPDVDWATASHSLSKLLIPDDRQTKSCRPEELAVPTIKKEKPVPQPISGYMDPSGRQLRGRKPVTSYADPGSDEDKAKSRAESRASRRRTIADLPSSMEEPPVAARSASRRMSIASSIGSVNGDLVSSRASSVMPGRRSATPAQSLPNEGVQVKKARGTTTTSSRIPKNAPPVPRVPSDFLKKSSSIKEKENDQGMDQLTTGLKRITLKMPTKEEHDAKEKAKAASIAKTTTRKSAVPRAPRTTKASTTTTKKAPGRPAKTAKAAPASTNPTTSAIPIPEPKSEPVPRSAAISPEPPQIQHAATATLQQPVPQSIEPAPIILSTAPPPEPQRKASASLIDPRLIDPEMISSSPNELSEVPLPSEQLPDLAEMGVVANTGLRVEMTRSPSRPDTPPAPPPSTMPGFVNFTAKSFDGGKTPDRQPGAATLTGNELRWAAVNTDVDAGRTMSPQNGIVEANLPVPAAAPAPAPRSGAGFGTPAKRSELPVFSSTGAIPFASNPSSATVASGPSSVHVAPQGFEAQGDDTAQVKSEEATSGVDIWEIPATPQK